MIRSVVFLLVFISSFSEAQDIEKEFFDEFDNLTDESKSFYYQVGMKREFIRTSGTKTYTTESYMDTVYTYFTKDNKLRSKMTYDEGYRNGPYSAYYENGLLKQTGQYMKDGKKGNFISWYPDGRKQMMVEYTGEEKMRDNLADFKILDYWDSLGKPVVSNGNGICACSFVEERHGYINETGNVIDGFREGNWQGFKGDTLVFEETYANGEFVKGIRYHPEKYAYDRLEIQSEFTGGIEAMYKFIKENLKYPKGPRRRGEEGSVYVQFIVEKDGSLSGIYVLKGAREEIDEEAIRMMKTMPRWKPGRSRGRLVKSKFVLPLKFSLG